MRAYQVKVENSGANADGRLSAAEDSVRFYELDKTVVTAGITPDPYGGPDTDKQQLAQAVARYSAGGGYHGTDSGSANAYVLTALGSYQPPKAYFTGMTVEFFPANTNTDVSTINAFGIGSKQIRSDFGAPLAPGSIIKSLLCQLIYDATLNGGVGAFMLKPWASARGPGLPIHPEITATSNILTFTSGTGTMTINTGLGWRHRGWGLFNSTALDSGARTFATLANKTYHLRWHAPGTGDATPAATYPSGRFVLEDLADVGYNPSALAETDATFDTTFDDMLVARVVTNGSNALTITALANKALLSATYVRSGSATNYATRSSVPKLTGTINWARSPQFELQKADCDMTVDNEALVAFGTLVATPSTRYSFTYEVTGYYVSANYAEPAATLRVHA